VAIGVTDVLAVVLLCGYPCGETGRQLDLSRCSSPEYKRLLKELSVSITLSGCSWSVVLIELSQGADAAGRVERGPRIWRVRVDPVLKD